MTDEPDSDVEPPVDPIPGLKPPKQPFPFPKPMKPAPLPPAEGV